MTPFLKSTNSHAVVIQKTFLQYVESYAKFFKVAERRAIKVSPNQKIAWQNTFRLQFLLQERLVLRFEYLFGRDTFENVIWKSLDDIFERLNDGWSEVEEACLKINNASYGELSREITDMRRTWNPKLIDDPSRALERDSIFRSAQKALSESSKRLRIQLSR